MRSTWFLTLITAFLVISILSCSVGTVENGEPGSTITKEVAMDSARKAFAASNGSQIPEFKVSDSSLKPDDKYWYFFAEGTGQYARPGFHATIKVDKKTGQATLMAGE